MARRVNVNSEPYNAYLSASKLLLCAFLHELRDADGSNYIS